MVQMEKKVGFDLLQFIVVPSLCVQNHVFTGSDVCASCWSYACSVHVYSTGYLMARYPRCKWASLSASVHSSSLGATRREIASRQCAGQVQI